MYITMLLCLGWNLANSAIYVHVRYVSYMYYSNTIWPTNNNLTHTVGFLPSHSISNKTLDKKPPKPLTYTFVQPQKTGTTGQIPLVTKTTSEYAQIDHFKTEEVRHRVRDTICQSWKALHVYIAAEPGDTVDSSRGTGKVKAVPLIWSNLTTTIVCVPFLFW